MTVLVLTRPLMDATADLVIEELHRRTVPVHRLDPGEFPEELTLSARIGPTRTGWEGTWRGRHRDLRLSDITAVYYRRPRPVGVAQGLVPGVADWARDEARAGLLGVLTSMPCTWLNHPDDNAAAGVAPVALAMAARCGLTVPRTLITTDPHEARSFVASLPGGVAAYKPIGTGGGPIINGRRLAVWTSRVRADQITDGVAATAHQFQEWIPKRHEIRLTAVGEKLFAAEIHAHSEEARIDFRRDYDALTYRVCEVPDTLATGVRKLMAAFHLRYVAMDFLVNQTGSWFLVDVNPNGQFGFVPQLRQPITTAIADLLEGATP